MQIIPTSEAKKGALTEFAKTRIRAAGFPPALPKKRERDPAPNPSQPCADWMRDNAAARTA
jgi:hypothetical protein